MKSLEEKAFAKVNLYLHVTGKNNNGYHLLDSLIIFPDKYDKITVTSAPLTQKKLISLKIDGFFSTKFQNKDIRDNLVIKAAERLAQFNGNLLKPVQLSLQKNLPIASGIGGGSSDAAATLRLLKNYWQINISKDQLMGIALELGADVPVCLHSVPQRMQGIGEKLSFVSNLPNFGILLVNHGENVSTADVFGKRKKRFSQEVKIPIEGMNFDSFVTRLASCNNDLQETACSICPKIFEVITAISKLPDCRLVRMSGSGATCFALFQTAEQAYRASVLLAKQYSWWIWGGLGTNIFSKL
ncbi:4-diphosphocytidyl-2-C-methyl-D-erythritol kinase [Commensalibacter sp. Nvir]|uniref:4-(cytidine 5'-diphospho)-2-C-methyl-D-erythritol kinase n=1 Tax=Commensalibacter sp. Nvir TaxID=3069817 RepID=UPI002D49CC15|nr:4-diphosphocytidyl-2-C-methyl-D-erythritol kinase [Commensalibacter sp. Nvir]